jgi:hypothetical protein
MKQLRRFAAILLVLAFCPAAASAACSVTLAGAVTQQPLTYDTFQAGSARASISFTLKNTDSKPCSAAFAFFKPGEPRASASAASLAYRILSAFGAPITQSAAAPPLQLPYASNASYITIGANSTVAQTASVSVGEGQVVSAGVYTDLLTLQIYENSSGVGYARGLTATLAVTIRVNAQATLAIVGGGRTTTLNFGDLLEGASRSVQLLAYANHGFHLTVSSDNGGVMKPTDAAALAEGWRVPYKVALLKTEPIDLAQQRVVSIWPTATQRTGLIIPVDVYVGSTNGQRSGIYRDVITITIDPGS